MINILKHTLSIKRSHNSSEEAEFAAYLLQQVLPLGKLEFVDGMGNFAVSVGTSDTLFTCHTDTVHRAGGVNLFTEKDGFLLAKGAPLGADDGAGIAILFHMMKHKVAGTYLFCRAEEVGGQGSQYIADTNSLWLKQFKRAIAFDRKGTSDVITHQGSRCASDSFGMALSLALSEAHDGLLYAPSAYGVFTDTANFTHLIPECTNVSVGYYNEHSNNEKLDLHHLQKLADAVIKVDWEALPTERSITESLQVYKGAAFTEHDLAYYAHYEGGLYTDDPYTDDPYTDEDELNYLIDILQSGDVREVKRMMTEWAGTPQQDWDVLTPSLMNNAANHAIYFGIDSALDYLVDESMT
jgi:hypothetical protein